MKKKILTISIIFTVFLLTGCANNSSPTVKKSDTGICHEEGTNYYKNTKNFTPYSSLDECLNSGGRLPKK
jgi:PBP1b-binding outer membrane lipoprotein LpoB